MEQIEYGFPGPAFSDLRPDQRRYISNMMRSWNACDGEECWFDRRALNRAIKKAKQNLP